jgi:hypothetical protein
MPGLPYTLANGPGNLPDALQLMANFNMALLKDGSVNPTANIPMNGNKLTGLAAATVNGDAIRYEQVNGLFLPVAGGTMTGSLVLKNGSTSSPGLAFANSATTGIYSAGAGQWQMLSVGSQVFSTDGTNLYMGIPLSAQSHKIINLANGTASTDAAAVGQLAVVQTVFASGATTSTGTSTSFTSTVNTASITPTSSSNRILIIASGAMDIVPVSNSEFYLSLFRGATNLGSSSLGLYSVALAPSGATAELRTPATCTYVDSPATTSATTYTVYAASPQSQTWTYGRGKWNMILMEVV